MNRKRSAIEERRNKLLEMIRNSGSGELAVERVAQLLGVAPVTLRRDLAALDQQGLIVRSYGKVALVQSGAVNRQEAAQAARDRIAVRAAAFVEPGDTIFVNTSRTALRILQYISAPNVTVVTNNVLAINTPHREDMTILLTGGEVRYPKYAMVGDVAQRTLQSVKANKAFLGCSGLSVKAGMTTEFLSEAGVNNLMLTNVAGEVFLLAEHGKLGMESNFTSGDIHLIGNLITDKGADPDLVQYFQAVGVRVIRV